MTGEDVAAKAEARRAARARRRAAASPEAAAKALAALEAWLAPHRGRPLAAYLAIETEIDPQPLMQAWPGPTGVPVIEARDAPLGFALWRPGFRLVPGPLGTRAPEPAVPMVPEIVVLPLLAFDAAGRRLGYGGGFYDRTLAKLRAEGKVVAVGLAFAGQEVEVVPHAPWDEPIDAIATEAGMRVFR